MTFQFSSQFSKLENLIQVSFTQNKSMTQDMSALKENLNNLAKLVTDDASCDVQAARELGINLDCQYVRNLLVFLIKILI